MSKFKKGDIVDNYAGDRFVVLEQVKGDTVIEVFNLDGIFRQSL